MLNNEEMTPLKAAGEHESKPDTDRGDTHELAILRLGRTFLVRTWQDESGRWPVSVAELLSPETRIDWPDRGLPYASSYEALVMESNRVVQEVLSDEYEAQRLSGEAE